MTGTPPPAGPPAEPIFETVVTTVSAAGRVHVAPFGVRYRGAQVVLAPFRPSATLDNILATGRAVLNLLTDGRVFAGCVTGLQRDWPTVPALPGDAGVQRLPQALGHVVLRLAQVIDDAQRPTLLLNREAEAQHAPFRGLNRAQAAVVEGAVLVSRLHMLPPEKIDRELAYLQIAIDKTASAEDWQAWHWLLQAVARHRAGLPTA